MSASTEISPPQINLSWLPDPKANSYIVQRRSRSDLPCGSGIVLPAGATAYRDANVTIGTAYEYRVTKVARDYVGHGYLWAGIEAPLIENRGKIILVIDSTYVGDLAAELERFEQDLTGDGWFVLRQVVSRNDSPASVKAAIKSHYDSDRQNVRAVLLFGHVPVPYSGNIHPDGHENHRGAWPADVFYADMDGSWTDAAVHTTTAERRVNWNVPGDGKFDQGILPSDVELEVGRVDLAEMTAFSNKTPPRVERDLLRQYLNKNHNFRHRKLSVERRALIVDHFGLRETNAVVTSGWRNFAAFFGPNNIFQAAVSNYLSTAIAGSYLWSYGAGGGSYYYSAGVATADEFAVNDVRVVFGMFLGSYYGDWNNESNFLRAFLGGQSYSLVAVYAGFPHWFCHHMALGETIGFSTRLTQNNGAGGSYEPIAQGAREVHIALMGDPTLRLHPVTPPSNLSVASAENGTVLRWTASADSDLQGYHVYRALSQRGPFVRVNAGPPVTGTSFNDSPPRGTHTYMVRAIKLERSASGSYYNASQGVFATSAFSSGDPAPPPPQPLSLSGFKPRQGPFQLHLIGPSGARFVLETSGDLLTWSPLLTNYFVGGEFQFADPGATRAFRRFYRCRLSP